MYVRKSLEPHSANFLKKCQHVLSTLTTRDKMYFVDHCLTYLERHLDDLPEGDHAKLCAGSAWYGQKSLEPVLPTGAELLVKPITSLPA